MKQVYVVGFLFNGDRVVLIRKNKPEWMNGLLNGVGGKVEPGEAPISAMIREFGEEAGAYVTDWRYFCLMSGPDWDMYCYYARNLALEYVRSCTDEPIMTCQHETIQHSGATVVPNLKWMVPMALQFEKDGYGPYYVVVSQSHLTGDMLAWVTEAAA